MVWIAALPTQESQRSVAKAMKPNATSTANSGIARRLPVPVEAGAGFGGAGAAGAGAAVNEEAADALEVAHHDCVVFEDSPSGVLAAKSARMQCVAVPTPENRDNKFIQTADIILDSLEGFSLDMLSTF